MKKGIHIAILLVLLQTGAATLNAQYQDHRNRGIDTLEVVLAANPPTGAKLVSVYDNLMWGYLQTDSEKSMNYARKCIATAIPHDEWQAVTNAYIILALLQYGNSRYDSAEVYYGKALDAAGQMRDFSRKYNETNCDNMLSSVYGNMGNLYNIQGKYHEAAECYQKALKLFEKHGWAKSQAVAYSNIGEMYLCMDNYEQAEINYVKSDVIAHRVNDTLLIAHAKRGFSQIFLHRKDYGKALENAGIAHRYYFAYPEEEANQTVILNILADICIEGYGDDLRAEEYARQALVLLEELDIPREKAISLRLLSAICLKRGEWRKAEQTALEALATDDSEPANTLTLYEILAKAYSKLGNSDKANEYFDKHNTLQSSWATKHYQSAIREMEVKYDTEKKETQIVTLETEKRMLTWLSITGGGILILGLAVSLLLWRTTIQKKRHAEQQIKQLEQEKQLIATQALLDGEIQERARLARDLHDGLGSMLTGSKMNIESLKNDVIHGKADASRCDNAISLLNNSTHELRRIAHHLMPDALTRFGLKTTVGDFCDVLSNVSFTWYGNDTRLEPKLETMIYRTICELVNNVLKHARASQIIVQIIQEPDRIAFTVQDDGCGFDPLAETKGMGLQNIRTRVASFGGIMNIESGNEGTEVNVELKIED